MFRTRINEIYSDQNLVPVCPDFVLSMTFTLKIRLASDSIWWVLLIIVFVCHGLTLYAAFVDFTKAFDYLVRDVIWYKLIKNGVRGKMLDIIKSMYENVRSRVKYNNTLGDVFSCFKGQPRGITLSIVIQYVPE